MKTKSLLVLAATMFAASFTSCNNDIIEKTPNKTEIITKSSIEGAYNSNFMNDGIPDYIAEPLVDLGSFYKAEVICKDFETLSDIEPEIHGYYAWNEDMREGNDKAQKLGITCRVYFTMSTRIGLQLQNIDDNQGILIIHTVARNKYDGHMYDRYIKVSLSN